MNEISKINSFKDLIVWQKSMLLTRDVYRIVGLFPKYEQYGLASQMRRSAVSIPSNIAEGHRRRHRKEYVQFLNIANASSAELETQLLLSQTLYPETSYDSVLKLLEEIQRMLSSMIRKLS